MSRLPWSRQSAESELDDGAPRVPVVTLIGRSGCHLCDAARAIVVRVTDELGARLVEIDVDTDPELRARYSDEVPVTLVDGRQHDFWRVSEDRLRAALLAAGRGGRAARGGRGGRRSP
jgi:hypothetical protein